MSNDNLHSQIINVADGSATESQCNYLIALYKQQLIKSVTKSMKNIDVSNDYMNFRFGNSTLKGTFALHLYNTFIPLNPAKYTRHSVSKMIQDAMNKKFDKVFIKEFLKSKNSYVKPEATS